MSDDIPIVVTSQGPQPQSPASLLAQLLTSVAAVTPGYTANLPGSMIEDISSTDTGALVICDSARVELMNSISPLTANQFMLLQLGQIYIGQYQGAVPAPPSNTSVYAVFAGSVGFVIDSGFIIGDGTYQYIVQDGGIIGSDGFSTPLFCIATIAGSWAVPTNTVTQIASSVPSGITLSVTNQTPGTPGLASAESEEGYRARVLQAGLAVSPGMTTRLKTALGNVSGVQQRLVSVRQQTGGGWEVLVGGGDPYQVANAIFTALFDFSTLVGSQLLVTNITQASPGVVTTNLNHGYTTGQIVVISGVVGMTPINNQNLTATVIDENHFSIGENTSVYPPYISGGVVSPNLRNVSVNILDYPDIYSIIFVSPPVQTVTAAVTYNTTGSNFVSQAAVAQLAGPAMADYINSITVGQPINTLLLADAFLDAVAPVLSAAQVSVLTFAVSINGISTPPSAGTNLIFGDPESYFETSTSAITFTQG